MAWARSSANTRVGALYSPSGKLHFRLDEIRGLSESMHSAGRPMRPVVLGGLSIGTLYHEAAHRLLDRYASQPDFASFIAQGVGYYRSQGVSDAETVFDEAVGNYIGHRVDAWWQAKMMLSQVQQTLQQGGARVDGAKMRRNVDIARKDYAAASQQRLFGYDRQGRNTEVPMSDGIKAFVDSRLLEGRMGDVFDQVFRSDLDAIDNQIRSSEQKK